MNTIRVATARIGNLIKIIESQNILGENVLWHSQQQAIYWLDIEAALLQRYSVKDMKIESFSLPQRMGSFAFYSPPIDLEDTHTLENKSDKIIAAFEQGIAFYNLKSSKISWLCQPEMHIKGNRFNDGRADRQGRFWAGTMVENENEVEQKASLYRVSQQTDHKINCEKILTGLSISNGLCWSPDSKVLYHADSPQQQIDQYDYCPKTGNISNKKLFAKTSEQGFPDGSTVDEQGFIWSAQWGSSQVVRYDPQGKINLVLTLPVSQPTCIALGGPNLDWLIITTAKHTLSKKALIEQPLSGNVFIYQLHNIKGIAEAECTLAR